MLRILLFASAAAVCCSNAAAQGGVPLPARFEANRVWVRPVTAGGDTLLLYTDTGGGANMLYRPAAERLHVAAQPVVDGRATMMLAPWPAFAAGAAIPRPSAAAPFEGRLLVVPVPAQGGAALLHRDDEAGFLGRTWFADGVWTFDYPARRLLRRTPAEAASLPGRRVPLGFRTDAQGRRTHHFPRIRVAVDGDSLDLLFDTGASTALTPAALAALGDGLPAARATSFIAASVFDRWRARHPDWRVVDAAEQGSGMAMIEVPRVEVAGFAVGPVWFTRRPDPAFHQFMSQWMDRQIEGALGGSALRFFRVTLDYPDAVAIFERP